MNDVYDLAVGRAWLAEAMRVGAGAVGVLALLAGSAGLIAALLPNHIFKYDEIARARMRWLRIIVGIVVTCACIVVWFAPALESRAGPEIGADGTRPAFTSVTAWLLDTRTAQARVIPSFLVWLVATLFMSVLANVLAGSAGVWLLMRYKRVQMLGLRWPSMPRHGRLEFDVARVAPQLPRLTSEIESDLRGEEQRGGLARGNLEAMRRIASEIERDLVDIQFAPMRSRSAYRLEFTSSAWRSLEIALRRTDESRVIVVSPFERAVMRDEVGRAVGAGLRKVVAVDRPCDLVEGTRQAVAVRAADACFAAVGKLALPEPVLVTLVVSLVDHMSGRVVPISELRSELGVRLGQDRVDVIIDGTQAAGNLNVDVPDFNFAALYAPAHKWLMSPYRGAFMWSRSTAVDRYEPLDVWSSATKSIRVDARNLLALRSACGFWIHFTQREIRLRVSALRKQLVDELRPKLVEAYVAGAPSPPDPSELPSTGIVYFRPGAGHVWKLGLSDLQNAIIRDGIQAAVMEIDGESVAVRLCVSTVTDGYQIIKVRKLLLAYVS